MFGDLNVDLEKDEKKSDELINWADSCSLAPFKPDAPTSLRSERIIDYAFSTEIPIQMQTYEDGTTSDHKPIITVISTKSSALTYGRNIHWKVFSWFSFLCPAILGGAMEPKQSRFDL